MNSRSSDDYESDTVSGTDRPNRWNGAPSTWQSMNQEEINTLTALNEIRNSDLSVHLYNAFALKKRHNLPGGERTPVPNQDINAATGEIVQGDDWKPQRSWTAWPMSAGAVPPVEYMGRTEDDDDNFTIKKPGMDKPSFALEDAVTGTILRFSREKFESRLWEHGKLVDQESEGDDDLSDDVSIASGTTRSRSRRSVSRSTSRVPSASRENSPERENLDVDDSDSDPNSEEGVVPLDQRHLQPAVSADDDLSYDLLRPTVRHILTKLDATLSILHNQREATLGYSSDPGSEPEAPKSLSKKKRGRSASNGRCLPFRPPPPEHASQEDGQTDSSRKKAGRPKKVYPRLEDETDKEYAIRVARIRKEPVPQFPSSDSEDENAQSDSSKKRGVRRKRKYPRLKGETHKQYAIRIARLQKKSIPQFSSSDSEDESNIRGSGITKKSSKRRKSRSRSRDSSSDASQVRREKNRIRHGLRDWRDIFGATALAGFSQAALDRTARRCANLFGQSMELRTMTEGERQDNVVKYEPGMVPALPTQFDEESENSDGDDRVSQTKRRIRSVSVTSNDSRGRSSSKARIRSRSRSRSASVVGSHFCHVSGCPRSVDGFSRRANLVRHIKTIHNLDDDELQNDVDSEDEMAGAVHVDGFLKPIKVRRGWRGEDIQPRSPRRRARGRKRQRDDSDDEMGDRDNEDTTMGEESH